MSTHTTVQCNSNKTHRGVCGLCAARSSSCSESYLLLSVCVTCLVTQGLLHTPYHRLPPPTYTRAHVKTSEEMAIQSPHNGKVKCYRRRVGSKGELNFTASVTTKGRWRYEQFLLSTISGSMECEKTGQLCPPGGNNKGNNQDLDSVYGAHWHDWKSLAFLISTTTF